MTSLGVSGGWLAAVGSLVLQGWVGHMEWWKERKIKFLSTRAQFQVVAGGS